MNPQGRISPRTRGPLLDAAIVATYMNGKRPSVHVNAPHRSDISRSVHLCEPYAAGSRLQFGVEQVEDVWCPTTELGTWTMRQNGRVMLTGNSAVYLNDGYTGKAALGMCNFAVERFNTAGAKLPLPLFTLPDLRKKIGAQ